MIRRPPRSTRTDTLFPYTTLFRSLNLTCVRPNSRAFFSEARISATPPSEGLQNIYCVRGSLIMREARIAPWSIAARRQAWGVRAPFSNALDATRASVRAETIGRAAGRERGCQYV